jgi:DNA-binding MarR family transcriptional regulator
LAYFKRIYEDGRLPKRAKLVFFYLHDRMDGTRTAWPGLNRIALDLSLSRSTVKRAIADLEKAGYLRKELAWRKNNGQSSNKYHILR